MGPPATDISSDTDDLLRRAQGGDAEARTALLEKYRDRLIRMIRLRLDRRLSGQVDPSALLNEAFLAVERKLPRYERSAAMPFYLWLRQVTGETLADVHRRHLESQGREAGLEVSLYRGALPQASSVSLAAQLLGKMTSATEAAIRAEHKLIVQEALNSMDPTEREVLVLRHFEHLGNDETALVLGIKKSVASQSYIRALLRLKQILSAIPGLKEQL